VLCSAWQRAIGEMESSESARDWIANRIGTTVAGLERMMAGIRVISLHESREWLAEPRPQLLASLARLQRELLDAGLLTAPTPFEPLFRWPAAVGTSSCRG
jgi:hypothetical protein